MRKFLILSAAAILAPLSVAALAQTAPQYAQTPQALQPAAPFSDPRNVPADLARIDAALNSTTSFQGRFTQYGADGTFSQGTIYLQRPGKLRFEYDDPNPLLIVSDGVTMTQQDKALETFDRVPLSATPLNYFLKENVNLANDTEVVALQKFPQEWRVTARDGSGEMDGAITMVLDPQSLQLREWVISDSFGGQTRVMLSDLQYNGRVDPRLFILREDSNRRDRRR
ncbi:LolA family protein [Litorimonas sp. RW-G-Af-16]|uniref:LolA family protein n=1 Tax=Litorimonas sp. RW-G-Af-16 TaxID=3241168 RepID=UPI00390C93B6